MEIFITFISGIQITILGVLIKIFSDINYIKGQFKILENKCKILGGKNV